MSTLRAFLLFVFALAATGCAESALSVARSGGGYDDDDDYADEAPSDDDDGDGAADDDDEPPPEEEDDFLASEPRGTDVWVFVANPTRDTVSKIHAVTREVQTIDVGDEPDQVVVSSDYQRAVTFNAGDDSVSVIEVSTNEVVDLDVREDFNFITMDPSGRWVVAWFNAAAEDADFDVDGVRSFTEVSFVDTIALQVQSFSVGFNPKAVKFTAASDRAVIISDAFITVADLTVEPIALDLLDLDADPLDPPVAAEVEITPAGQWAFVRYAASDDVQAVHLQTGELGFLDAGESPTDLDLTPYGLEAVVVARGSGEVRMFDAPDPLNVDPEILPTPEGSIIGSLVLAPDGETGLLFTTAALEDRITFWDRATDELTVRGLAKPIDAVAISPDGASALIIHTLEDAPGEDDVFSDGHALSVVDLETWLTNPVALEDKPLRWTTSDDGRYTLFAMETNRNVGVIDYDTRLVDDVLVPSQPVFLGMMPSDADLPETVGWVSQEHELGRISFIQPVDLSVETVTGFELNSGID